MARPLPRQSGVTTPPRGEGPASSGRPAPRLAVGPGPVPVARSDDPAAAHASGSPRPSQRIHLGTATPPPGPGGPVRHRVDHRRDGVGGGRQPRHHDPRCADHDRERRSARPLDRGGLHDRRASALVHADRGQPDRPSRHLPGQLHHHIGPRPRADRCVHHAATRGRTRPRRPAHPRLQRARSAGDAAQPATAQRRRVRHRRPGLLLPDRPEPSTRNSERTGHPDTGAAQGRPAACARSRDHRPRDVDAGRRSGRSSPRPVGLEQTVPRAHTAPPGRPPPTLATAPRRCRPARAADRGRHGRCETAHRPGRLRETRSRRPRASPARPSRPRGAASRRPPPARPRGTANTSSVRLRRGPETRSCSRCTT